MSITPKSTSNLLVFEGTVVWVEYTNSSNTFVLGLFHDGVAQATTTDSPMNNGGGCTYQNSDSYACTTPIRFVTTAPSTSAESYEIRVAGDGNGLRINRTLAGHTFGNSLTSSFSVTEIAL